MYTGGDKHADNGAGGTAGRSTAQEAAPLI
jgi:hypothetical protein